MGLFAATAEEDKRIALTTADFVAIAWNRYAAQTNGFRLFIEPQPIDNLIRLGAALFSRGVFPQQPGPFKRTAAFLVLGRLYPFFRPSGRPENVPQNDDLSDWNVRWMALTIPILLRQARVTLNGQLRPLNEWNGFPSPHYQLEFFAWLRWLDSGEGYKHLFRPEAWTSFFFERLARMVMSTALILEACYYVNGQGITEIQSQVSGCLSELTDAQTLDLIYVYDIENQRELPLPITDLKKK